MSIVLNLEKTLLITSNTQHHTQDLEPQRILHDLATAKGNLKLTTQFVTLIVSAVETSALGVDSVFIKKPFMAILKKEDVHMPNPNFQT